MSEAGSVERRFKLGGTGTSRFRFLYFSGNGQDKVHLEHCAVARACILPLFVHLVACLFVRRRATVAVVARSSSRSACFSSDLHPKNDGRWHRALLSLGAPVPRQKRAAAA